MENMPLHPKSSDRLALGIILALSATAGAFLLWLLYWHHPPPELSIDIVGDAELARPQEGLTYGFLD